MTEMIWPIAALLPHAGPAILLDEVVSYSDSDLRAAVTVREDSPFHQDNGIPTHVGIEYMAQACGAFSGIQARRDGTAPRVGFILGTRRYLAKQQWFADATRLMVTVTLVYRDGEVGVFDCTISAGEDVLAEAQLIVAEPHDAAALPAREDSRNHV
jgi:predicted hotdog family 3-hydroxylacyl-ACP dehydratase